MKHWLVKQEPDEFSWDDCVKANKAIWDGVRNYQARNNMRTMELGDLVFFYHSVTGKEVVGITKVVKTAYPDPVDPNWSAVDLEPVKPLNKTVPLDLIKATPELQGIHLVKQSRLSVMPLTEEEFNVILRLGETKLD